MNYIRSIKVERFYLLFKTFTCTNPVKGFLTKKLLWLVYCNRLVNLGISKQQHLY